MNWLCSYHDDTVMRTILCEETEAISCVLWATVAGRSFLNGDDNWETSVRDKPVHMLSIPYCLEPRGVRVKVHSTIPTVQSFNPLLLHGNEMIWILRRMYCGRNTMLCNLLDVLMAYSGFIWIEISCMDQIDCVQHYCKIICMETWR